MKHFFSLRPWILTAVVLASAGTTVAAQGKMEAYPANEKWFVSGSVGAGVYVGDYDMHAQFGNRISITGDVSGGKLDYSRIRRQIADKRNARFGRSHERKQRIMEFHDVSCRHHGGT